MASSAGPSSTVWAAGGALWAWRGGGGGGGGGRGRGGDGGGGRGGGLRRGWGGNGGRGRRSRGRDRLGPGRRRSGCPGGPGHSGRRAGRPRGGRRRGGRAGSGGVLHQVHEDGAHPVEGGPGQQQRDEARVQHHRQDDASEARDHRWRSCQSVMARPRATRTARATAQPISLAGPPKRAAGPQPVAAITTASVEVPVAA